MPFPKGGVNRPPTPKELERNKKFKEAGEPYRWKPGQSGNPHGPEVRLSFEAVVAKVLDEKIPGTDQTKREALARVFVDQMLKRDGAMIKQFLEREWPVVQQIEIEDKTESTAEPFQPDRDYRDDLVARLKANGDGRDIH